MSTNLLKEACVGLVGAAAGSTRDMTAMRRPATMTDGYPRVDDHHYGARRETLAASVSPGLIDGSGFARAAESPRTLPAYTEWHRLDLAVRGGAGRASSAC